MRESPEFEVIAGSEHPQLPQIQTTFFSCLSSYKDEIYTERGKTPCLIPNLLACIAAVKAQKSP
jgi:hypothetical protein